MKWRHEQILAGSLKQGWKSNYECQTAVQLIQWWPYCAELMCMTISAWKIHRSNSKLRNRLNSNCILSLRSHQVPVAGTFPGKRDFPRQSHSVDARRDFSRWSHQTCWVRGREERPWARNWYRAAVFIKCAHARIVVARWPNVQPVRTAETTQPWLSPESGGIRWLCGRSVVKKDKTSPNCPRQTGPDVNAGLKYDKCSFSVKWLTKPI